MVNIILIVGQIIYLILAIIIGIKIPEWIGMLVLFEIGYMFLIKAVKYLIKEEE